MRSTFQRNKQSGQGMTEYLIIALLIAIAAILVFTYFGQAVRHQAAGMTSELAGGSAASSIQGASKAANGAGGEASKNKTLSSYQNQPGK